MRARAHTAFPPPPGAINRAQALRVLRPLPLGSDEEPH